MIEHPANHGVGRCRKHSYLRSIDRESGACTPGHQSLLVHLKKSGFIILSGDVVHTEDNFEKDIVPSLNTNKADSIASMEKIRQMIGTYKATLFINHDKAQTDHLRLLPAFYA